MPAWCKGQPKEVQDLNQRARWVAAWWVRALAQLTALGHAQKQTVSFSDLLAQLVARE